MQNYYSAQGYEPVEQQAPRHSWKMLTVVALVSACLAAFITYEVTSQVQVRNFVNSALPTAVRPATAVFASRRGETSEAKPAFPSLPQFGKKEEAPKPAPKRQKIGSAGLENIGQITAVGAKVVGELALYLAFNTAYFVSNTYQFLTEEEQKKMAKQTVDKQLPELLALIGGTTDALSKTASTVADTPEYQDLKKSAAEAAAELTKGLKTENVASPEVIGKLKNIVADDNGEVLSEERKSAILETLKKGGVKGTELSLYLFYNVFSVLRNLDRVLPTAEQTGGIESKIEELGDKIRDFAEQVKEIPSQGTGSLADKVEQLKDSLPSADDLANLDPAEVSLSVRSALANTKTALDGAVEKIDKALAKDSEVRKTLDDVGTKLKPVVDGVGSLVAKLPLPKNADGSVDYSKLLADAGIVTVKGLKALIEATKKAANSVSSKTEA